MKKWIFCLAASVGMMVSLPASAQNTVESIRKEYQEVQQHIQRMMDPESFVPKEFYALTVHQNLPATGPHQEDIHLYYNEDEDDEDKIYLPHYLRFATTKYNIAARPFYEEFLYNKKGEVIFIYGRKLDNDVTKLYEFRMWYDGNRLLQVMIKSDESDDPNKPEFKDMYTGKTVPEQFSGECNELEAEAQMMKQLFKDIDSSRYPYSE